MLIEFAPIFLLVFIIPGYLILIGMKAGCRFDLKASNQGQVQQSMQLLVLSMISLIIITPILFLVGQLLFYFLPVDTNFTSAISSDYYGLVEVDDGQYTIHFMNWYTYTILYFIAATLFFGFGYVFVKLIESGIIKISIFHGSLYQLIVGSDMPVIYCSILTRLKHGDSFIVYRGELHDISYSTNSKIDYLALRAVERIFLKIKDRNGKVVAKNSAKTVGHSKVTYFKEISPLKGKYQSEMFLIDGEEIANVLFSRLNYPDINVKELIEELENLSN